LVIEQAFYAREARQWQRMQSAFVSITSQCSMPAGGAGNKNICQYGRRETMSNVEATGFDEADTIQVRARYARSSLQILALS